MSPRMPRLGDPPSIPSTPKALFFPSHHLFPYFLQLRESEVDYKRMERVSNVTFTMVTTALKRGSSSGEAYCSF